MSRPSPLGNNAPFLRNVDLLWAVAYRAHVSAPVVSAPVVSTVPATTPNPYHLNAPATRLAHHRRTALAHRPAVRTRHPQLDLSLVLEHRIEQIPGAVTRALGPVSHEDGVLFLFAALGFAVFVVASSTLLRLLVRIQSEGWEVREP